MISLKSSKSRSSSKVMVKTDLDGYIKSISSTARQQFKRINNQSTANIPNKQFFCQNKQNSLIEKDYLRAVNNTDYIKSLYKKYLGKDSDGVQGERTMRNLLSQSNIKQIKDNSFINIGLNKLNSYRELTSKHIGPTLSSSKKQVIKHYRKQTKKQDKYHQQLLQLCDSQDSCVKATILLRQTRNNARSNN